MTRLATLALLVFATALAVPGPMAQSPDGAWSLLDASPFHSYRFEDGDFIDPETGWVVNPRGEVWKTADGGASWALLSEYSQLYLRSVAFPTDQLGFVGTLWSEGPLWRTTDGGITFENASDRIEGLIPQGICGLQALSEDVVVGVGWFAGPAHFVKTTDGGETWTSRDLTDVLATAVDVHFWDEQRGIVIGGSDLLWAGGGARVAYTEDGGETWAVRYTTDPGLDASEWGWKTSFPTPDVGYISVEHGAAKIRPAKVLKTVDAGLSWTELTIPGSLEAEGLQGVGFITEDVGWASGRGTTSATTDGGQTWEQLDLDGRVNRFEFFGDTLAYAMGTRIYQLERLSTASEAPAESASFGLDAAFPNPTAGGLTVAYRTGTMDAVDLAVFDLLGRRMATLATGPHAAGLHREDWDGRGDRGAAVAPGVYLVRLVGGGRSAVQRVTVVGR